MPATDLTIRTQEDLVALCRALIDPATRLTAAERALPHAVAAPRAIAAARRAMLRGADPLGEAFVALRPAAERRATGAVYTPAPIVQAMTAWLAGQGTPERIVDPGAGSGRFLIAAGQVFPKARLIGIENDPLAALMLRAAVSVHGWAARTTVMVKDYRAVTLPRCAGVTGFIGNPPYLRHHDLGEAWKRWYADGLARLGIKGSSLAGLHLHFFLQTRLLARPGDLGAFITSAEWVDVNYGSALRRLLLDELGGLALHVLEPQVEAFPGTATTAAIACFRVGSAVEPMRVRSVADLPGLNGLTSGDPVPRETLRAAPRWSVIIRPTHSTDGEIELGALFRVHRGQVTGANAVWIAGEHAKGLPDSVQFATVTKARDLINAGASLRSAKALRRVIDLPLELDDLSRDERKRVSAFLAWARQQGADQGYIARHRRAWWSVGLRAPAPILCTYMARRAPQFTLNTCAARHINIAHGLYPREPIAPAALCRLVTWLNAHVSTGSGRTYAGGLTKFEPKEIERLRIPRLETLTA